VCDILASIRGEDKRDWHMMRLILWALTTLLAAFVGSYLGSYLKKKGENRAIQEDIGKLVEQVSAVTQATKEIETKISSDLWDRQKRWELKREVLFEATKNLAEVEEALLVFNSVLQVERREQKEGQPGWAEAKHERIMRWSKASAAFDETRQFVRILCGKETVDFFEAFALLVSGVAAGISEKDYQIYRNSYAELIKKEMAVRAAVRKELGIDGLG
jgi:hypothetical protein